MTGEAARGAARQSCPPAAQLLERGAAGAMPRAMAHEPCAHLHPCPRPICMLIITPCCLAWHPRTACLHAARAKLDLVLRGCSSGAGADVKEEAEEGAEEHVEALLALEVRHTGHPTHAIHTH